MLTGAVLGGVFASPSSSAVLSAILALSGAPGCLLIVKNYTGDRLNFGIAMEKARAAGIKCEMCIVGDDCALPKDKGITGRRGIAGTLFIHKVAGAAAAAGRSLEDVTAQARDAADNVASMGVALSTCTLPGSAPNTRLDGDLVEIGSPSLPPSTHTHKQTLNHLLVDCLLFRKRVIANNYPPPPPKKKAGYPR